MEDTKHVADARVVRQEEAKKANCTSLPTSYGTDPFPSTNATNVCAEIEKSLKRLEIVKSPAVHFPFPVADSSAGTTMKLLFSLVKTALKNDFNDEWWNAFNYPCGPDDADMDRMIGAGLNYFNASFPDLIDPVYDYSRSTDLTGSTLFDELPKFW